MINLSDTLVRMMNYQDYEATQGVRLLYIFDGVPPTKSDIESIKALDGSGDIRTGNIISFASGRGDNMIQANIYDGTGGDALSPRFPNNKLVQWPLSERPEEFRTIQDGDPTWFVFCVSDNTSVNPDPAVTDAADIQILNVKCTVCYFGTCGDEESEADLAILGGTIDGNKEYSTTDLEIFFI